MTPRGEPSIFLVVLGVFLSFVATANCQVLRGQSLDNLKKAAEKGDSDAQLKLGNLYIEGRAVEKDYVEAIKWLRTAAESSNSVAQLELGLRYLRGDKVATNQIDGLKWLQRAAGLDLAQAQFELSKIYGEGRGAGKDLSESYAWANLAAPRIGEAAEYRELLEKQMTFDQVLAGQERSRKLRQQIPIRIHIPQEDNPQTEEQLLQDQAYQRAKEAADQRRLARESDIQHLGTGYSTDKGVKIDVGGAGGKNYGNYALTVKQRYEAAWRVAATLNEDDRKAEI